MKRTIYLIIFLLLLSFAYAVTDGDIYPYIKNHYTLDNATDIETLNDGTSVNGGYVNARIGKGYLADSNSEYFALHKASYWCSGGGDFFMYMWLNQSVGGSNSQAHRFIDTSAPCDMFMIAYDGLGFRFQWGNMGFASEPSYVIRATVPTGWFLFTITYNQSADELYFYVDDTLNKTVSGVGNMTGQHGSITDNPNVANGRTGDPTTPWGVVDEFVKGNKTLSLDEVQFIYSLNRSIDSRVDSSPPDSITITTRDIYNNSLIDTTITINNAVMTNTTNTTNGQVTFYVTDGLYNISIVSPYYYNQLFINYNTTNDLTANLTYHKARYKTEEKFKDFYTNATIQNYSVSFYYTENDSLEGTFYGVNGNMTALLNWNSSYYGIIDAENYEYKNFSLNTTDNGFLNETLYFYGINTVRITIKDEESATLINDRAVDVLFTSAVSSYDFTTNNGTLAVFNLTPESYTVKFNSSGYVLRTYSIVVANRSTQELNAFLTKSATTTIFTIKDKGTLNPIQNVLLTMYRFINSSWTPIESKYSDITGKVQVSYEDYVNYKFYLSKSDYEDLIFYLDPILFDEYTVQMEKTTTLNTTQDYDHVSIIYAPKSFVSGANTFNFIIQCPYGELISYGYTLTFPNSTATETGTNTLGSQLTSNFNITNPTIYDTVRIDYYYYSTVVGYRNFTYYYPIEYQAGNNTMAQSFTIGGTYGLGLLERAIITVVLGILTIGTATLLGNATIGVILCFAVWSYLVYVGFISIWLVIVSVVIGFLLMSVRGDN